MHKGSTFSDVIIKQKKRHYNYSLNTKNNSSLRRKVTKIYFTLNNAFSTDGVTLSVKARSEFFDEWHFVNEAVKFPVASLENMKLVLIKVFVTVQF